jgi:hypothetical protein
MKKRTLLLSMVFVFALVAIVNSAAIAQDQSLHPQMQQNLSDMSKMMEDISAQLQRMSHILQDLAGLGHGIHSKHQTDIKKMKKDWNPFAEEATTEN